MVLIYKVKYSMSITRTNHTHTSRNTAERDNFAQLMRLGNIAYAQGNYRGAHRLWRRAAIINPQAEEVWVALLTVLETEEDRRVCLQNIIAINPRNRQAIRQLRQMGGQEVPDDLGEQPTQPIEALSPKGWRYVFLRLSEALLLGVLLAFALLFIDSFLVPLPFIPLPFMPDNLLQIIG
jgi:tetratricopeptide (TPR) repeat protein